MSETVSTDLRELDALVVGAGFSGLYMLHRLRDTLGMSALVLEAADDVGGTWYWNRYPGARCDSESYFYSFSDWLSEELSGMDVERALSPASRRSCATCSHVADRFDLRRDIRFRHPRHRGAPGTRRRPLAGRHRGRRALSRARYLVTAVGCLSTTNMPDVPGPRQLRGRRFHTGRWPHEGVDFTGKRVAVIGTGLDRRAG